MTVVDRPISRRSRRRLPTAGQGAMAPMAILLVGMLVLALCVSTTGFALLKVVSPPLPQAALPQAPSALPKPDPEAAILAQQREIESLDKELRDVQQRIQELDLQRQPRQARIKALIQQQDQLTRLIEQRRASLRESEDAARRQAAQAEAGRQRLEHLRAEAAELERRIAALKANVGQAQETQRARAALERRAPQIVECVRGAVILQPQHTQIPVGSLRDGAFVTAVTGRGASFLVRPDGIDSFQAARAIARTAGVAIGYEPVLPGGNP